MKIGRVLSSAGRWAAAAAVVLAAFLTGRACAPTESATPGAVEAAAERGEPEKEPTIWTCPMHPQIRMHEPGKCPICGMDLIPLEPERAAGADSERRLAVSEEARALAEIETAPVERRYVRREVRMVGKVDYDETRIKSITAWVQGRIEKMFVDWTGVAVNEGDHMVVLYSPELLTAQRELQESSRRAAERPDDRFARVALEAAREKLRLLGLTDEQIEEIERASEPSDRITILAPAGGIVVERLGFEGMYVDVGSPIYRIADLRHLWVHLDAYESDVQWLRLGQEVTFEAESLPGEIFRGRITFIQPVLDESTRTVKVRVDVPNEDGRLKPGMFVRAVVWARLGAGGVVADDWLADKWICPMHPEVVSDGPDKCPKCGMPLATVEALGYARGGQVEPPLVVPRSAPLVTGRRAVVYVEVEGTDLPTYEGREVVLGPRAGDWYVVRDGLREGERVVVEGAFKIDSSLQIQAKRSMMSITWPDEESGGAPAEEDRKEETGRLSETPDSFAEGLAAVVEAYLGLQEALASDDADAGRRAGEALRAAFEGLPHADLGREAHEAFVPLQREMAQALELLKEAGGDLGAQRVAFDQITQVLDRLLRRFRVKLERPIRRVHCPMAFDDRGADWFQRGGEVRNPYFGDEMLECGNVVETLGGEER